MRFIIGFIFFGLLFYAIYLFLPETFQTLVGWASDIFNYIKDALEHLKEKPKPAPTTTPQSLFQFVWYR